MPDAFFFTRRRSRFEKGASDHDRIEPDCGRRKRKLRALLQAKFDAEQILLSCAYGRKARFYRRNQGSGQAVRSFGRKRNNRPGFAAVEGDSRSVETPIHVSQLVRTRPMIGMIRANAVNAFGNLRFHWPEYLMEAGELGL